MTRPSKDEYYPNIAKEIGKRGTCLRRNYSAVIVNKDQIVSTGYTGAPRGVPNCIDLGVCYRNKAGVPSGTNYELCRSVHAEMNAVIHAGRDRTEGAKLYMYAFDAEK
ncbi:MAG: cytidine deaminase, partial [archaeon]